MVSPAVLPPASGEGSPALALSSFWVLLPGVVPGLPVLFPPPPQATRASAITAARTSARIFFIFMQIIPP